MYSCSFFNLPKRRFFANFNTKRKIFKKILKKALYYLTMGGGGAELTTISVASANAIYSARGSNGVVLEGSDQLVLGCKYTIIPTSVLSIGNSAFNGCTGLTSITIPSSVTQIGDGAFNSTGLTSIVVPSSVTIIGNGAFSNCTALTNIKIDGYEATPLLSIWEYAFSGCTALTSIYLPLRVSGISTSGIVSCSPFFGCSSSLHIYCAVAEASKPAGWATYWNNYDSENTLTVTWNKTYAEYLEAISA